MVGLFKGKPKKEKKPEKAGYGRAIFKKPNVTYNFVRVLNENQANAKAEANTNKRSLKEGRKG